MNTHHVKSDTGPLHDIKILSKNQLTDQYGIEFIENSKQVWDPVENKIFNDLMEWATYVVEQDDSFDTFFTKATKGSWEDEY